MIAASSWEEQRRTALNQYMMKFFQRGTVRVSVSQLAMNNTLRTSDMAQMQDKRSPSTVTRDTGCNKCEHPYIPSVKKGAQADHQAGEVEQSLSSRSSPKSSASPSKCLVVRMPLTGRSTSMRASIRPSSLVVRMTHHHRTGFSLSESTSRDRDSWSQFFRVTSVLSVASLFFGFHACGGPFSI